MHGGPDVGEFISYDEAIKEGERRILFTGPRRFVLNCGSIIVNFVCIDLVNQVLNG